MGPLGASPLAPRDPSSPSETLDNLTFYLGAMFHVLWIGDGFEHGVDYFLLAIFFGCIFCSHMYCLHLYRRIGLKIAADKKVAVVSGRRTPAGDFSNIMNPASSRGNSFS